MVLEIVGNNERNEVFLPLLESQQKVAKAYAPVTRWRRGSVLREKQMKGDALSLKKENALLKIWRNLCIYSC